MGFFGSLWRGAKDIAKTGLDPREGLKQVMDPGGMVSDAYHVITGAPTAKDKRTQQTMLADQIKAYKDQTELTRQELNTKRDQVAAEKRRVEEKQIRSLRRNYRAPGFLGGGGASEPDMTAKLGG
jgi:chromatin segregation and condensation protein Rec8/ScpA/Scc1 (kleisin family)